MGIYAYILKEWIPINAYIEIHAYIDIYAYWHKWYAYIINAHIGIKTYYMHECIGKAYYAYIGINARTDINAYIPI